MKRMLALLLAGTMSLGMLAGCGGGTSTSTPTPAPANSPEASAAAPAPAADPIKLKWATQFNATHIYTIEFAQRFIDMVAEKTNGLVEIALYPGEQLGKAEDYPSMMASGMVDIANIDPGASVSEFPLHGVWQLPNAYVESSNSTPALLEQSRSGMLSEELAKNGMVCLGAFTVPGYVLFYNGKPIEKPSDVAGMKFRATGKSRILTMTDLGATVVSLSSSEVSEALYKKTIDGCVNSANAGIQYGYHEMVDYCTTGISVGGQPAGFSISQASWDKLPEDIQKIFLEVGEDCSLHVAELLDQQLVENLEGPIAEACTVIYVTDEDKALWDEAVAPIVDEWLADSEKNGYDGAGVLAERDELLAKYAG